MIFISICFYNQTWFQPLLYSQRLQAVNSYCKVLQISQYSLENTCARVSLIIKVAGLRSATLLKKRLCHRYFPGFYKIFKNIFFQDTSWRLLLDIQSSFITICTFLRDGCSYAIK